MVMRKGLGNPASSLQILSSGGVVDALADRNNNVSSVEEILWRKWMLRSKLQDQREQAGADKRWREVRITRIYGHFQDSANTSWVPRMAKCLPKHRRKKNKDWSLMDLQAEVCTELFSVQMFSPLFSSFNIWHMFQRIFSVVKPIHKTLWHKLRELGNSAIFHDTMFKINLLSKNVKITN